MPHAHASGFPSPCCDRGCGVQCPGISFELACPSPCCDRGGQAPRYGKKTVLITVGRGPVPRHAAIASAAFNAQGFLLNRPVPRRAAIAGDRPPRYGKKRFPRSRVPPLNTPYADKSSNFLISQPPPGNPNRTLSDSPKKSFADAKLRENPVQNIFRCRFSDDVAEGIEANM